MSAFALEEWALSGSTFVLSLALVGYGIFLWSGFSIPFVASGIAGMVATVVGTSLYRRRLRAVEALRGSSRVGRWPL
jgi:CHASE2 domain-containing sensor protein